MCCAAFVIFDADQIHISRLAEVFRVIPMNFRSLFKIGLSFVQADHLGANTCPENPQLLPKEASLAMEKSTWYTRKGNRRKTQRKYHFSAKFQDDFELEKCYMSKVSTAK